MTVTRVTMTATRATMTVTRLAIINCDMGW